MESEEALDKQLESIDIEMQKAEAKRLEENGEDYKISQIGEGPVMNAAQYRVRKQTENIARRASIEGEGR